MDVVIPLGTGSKWRDNELKFALRSIEKHLKDYRNIYIVGECPKFISNVTHIPAKDFPGRKEFSIFSKIMKAVEDSRVSDDFVFWNDDIFMLQDLHVNDFKYWYEGNMSDKYDTTNGHYKSAIGNVIDLWSNNGYVNYTDIHTPIVYNKQEFKESVGLLDWSKEYVVKSSYTANTLNGMYEYMPDLKINKPMYYGEIMAKINGRLFFSIGPYGVAGGMVSVLNELYPNKSKYEV